MTEGLVLVSPLWEKSSGGQKTGCWIAAGVTVINAIRHYCLEMGWAFNFKPSPSARGAHLFFVCDCERAPTPEQSAQRTQSANDWLTCHLARLAASLTKNFLPSYMSVLPSRSILQRRAGSISCPPLASLAAFAPLFVALVKKRFAS